MTPERNNMIKDISLIIVLYGVAVAILEIIFAKNVIYSLCGLVLGCIIAIYMFIYMEMALQRSMNNGDAKAVEKYITKHSCIRYFSVVIVFFVICITRIADPLACFIGILGLKIAAYLQPAVNKLRKKPSKEA